MATNSVLNNGMPNQIKIMQINHIPVEESFSDKQNQSFKHKIMMNMHVLRCMVDKHIKRQNK